MGRAEAEELMQTSRQWSALVEAGDFAAALDYWADDAVVMAPGQPPLRGKAAIRAYIEATGAIPGFSISWEPLEAHVAASGDQAYMIERNRISVTDADGQTITEQNKVVTVWKKQPDGAWKNVIDMWNSDAPAE